MTCDGGNRKSLLLPFEAELGFERKARLFCDLNSLILRIVYKKCWDLSGRLGYFVTLCYTEFHTPNFGNCWDLSGRLGYFVTSKLAPIRFVMSVGWDLSGRLGYFVTPFVSRSLIRSACFKSWDLSGRLGYFVTLTFSSQQHAEQMLGFERKARLFCDVLARAYALTRILIFAELQR